MKFDVKPIFRALFWIIFFIVLAAVLFFVGLAVGYSVLGDGEMMDVFKYDTWQHILDYIR
ncbi:MULTISPECIES: DNA-directed RNA polymerase subunit beta [unclassified Jeotgalibaca]|uniref:DNA-directed RNA polymerase subunit beta n=1 Tax=unclassified Jeotgalibaca TaxID=2621505 RepID=UPI003FD0657B